MDEQPDPSIVKRLSKMPPYIDENGNATDTPVKSEEEPQESVNESTASGEEPDTEVVSTQQQGDEENPEAIPATPEEGTDEEVSEEEALKNSKQPERTKKYIDKLKKQNEELKRQSILDSLEPSYEFEPAGSPFSPTTNIIPLEPSYEFEPAGSPFSPTTNIIPTNVPGVSQQQVNEAFREIMDENGYVDRGLLNSTIQDLILKNQNLERQLVEERKATQTTAQKIDDFQREQVMRDIHNKYPKLNPENAGDDVPEDKRFDDRLWQYVHKEMVASWVREAESGKVVNPNDKKEQAKLIEKLTQKGMDLLSEDLLNDEGEVDPTRLMNRKEKQKLDEATNAKININATQSKQPHQEDWSDHEALVKATMRGEKGALAERLRRAGQ